MKSRKININPSKYLPDFGFEMTLAQENVLRIEAVPEALKESQVIRFLEKIFEILEYRTEEDFYKYFEYQWVKLKTKSKFDFIYKTEVEQLVKDFIDLGFPQYTVNGKNAGWKSHSMILKINFKLCSLN
jgi:DNA mismatch repair protein MutL